MDAIVLAGGRLTSDDPMYALTGGGPKALLEMGGKRMVEWVVAALAASQSVDRICVAGLSGTKIPHTNHTLPDAGSMLKNIINGLNWAQAHAEKSVPVLLISADIPLVTAQDIDQTIAACQTARPALMHYPFVTRRTLETHFPRSKRTYATLDRTKMTGGNVMVVHSHLAQIDIEWWQNLISRRKSPLKLAQLVGWRTLLKLITRRLKITDLETKASEIVGGAVHIPILPIPSIAMDADKPFQADMIRAALTA